MNFADKLQMLRKSNGLTQDILAEKMDVSRQAIARWEAGVSFPDILHLIQISEQFHVTLDYLVKEPSCVENNDNNLSLNEEELIAFRLEAAVHTYAGYGEELDSTRPASHDYVYKKGNYTYYDTWLGGNLFSGEEAVWLEQKPIYSMNYFGRVLDERFNGDFLKEALRNATKEMPYRGPSVYTSGEYSYKTDVVGDLRWFQGYEEIYCRDIKVYECYYHGGVL